MYSSFAFFVKDSFGTIHILRKYLQGRGGRGGGTENCDFCLFSVPHLRLRRVGRGGQKSLKMVFTQKWTKVLDFEKSTFPTKLSGLHSGWNTMTC